MAVINSYTFLGNATFVIHLNDGIVLYGNSLRQLFTDNEYCWEHHEMPILTSASSQFLANGVNVQFSKENLKPPETPLLSVSDFTSPPATNYAVDGSVINYYDPAAYGNWGGLALVYPQLITKSGWKWNGNKWISILEEYSPPPTRYALTSSGYKYQYLVPGLPLINPATGHPFNDIIDGGFVYQESVWTNLEEGLLALPFIWHNNRWVPDPNAVLYTAIKPDPNYPPLTLRRLVTNDGIDYVDKPIYYWDLRLDDWANLYEGLVVGKFKWDGTSWIHTNAILEWNLSTHKWIVIQGTAETNAISATEIVNPPHFVSGDYYTQSVNCGVLKNNLSQLVIDLSWRVTPSIPIPQQETYSTLYPHETRNINSISAFYLPAKFNSTFEKIDFAAGYSVTIDGAVATVYAEKNEDNPNPEEQLTPYEVRLRENGLIIFYYPEIEQHSVTLSNGETVLTNWDERVVRLQPRYNASGGVVGYDAVGVPVVITYAWKIREQD
ncbi:hypothetical protein [Chroococcidiopsis sp.]|uniref:hypothetical protein n=1 Tax=Chroococcidiopsis sp. TaxID=3088168 RepID=UPI003F31A2BE